MKNPVVASLLIILFSGYLEKQIKIKLSVEIEKKKTQVWFYFILSL